MDGGVGPDSVPSRPREGGKGTPTCSREGSHVLHELLANVAHTGLLGQRRREHEHLLVVRRLLEDRLHVLSHVCRRHQVVTQCTGSERAEIISKVARADGVPSASSMRSHSSSTKCLTLLRLRSPISASALIRPGVPTMMCGAFDGSLRSSLCSGSGVPPKIISVRMSGRYLQRPSRELGLAQ